MHWKFFGSLWWLLLAATFSLSAATYEVAPSNPRASDEGDGTKERPWQTISQAARKAGAGDTVIIHDGVYRETAILKTSGTAQAPVVFEAAPGSMWCLPAPTG